jgi:hypothetical protein
MVSPLGSELVNVVGHGDVASALVRFVTHRVIFDVRSIIFWDGSRALVALRASFLVTLWLASM